MDDRSRIPADLGSIVVVPDTDTFARRWATLRARAGALDLTRPFRRADALAAGITRSELAGPMFRRIFTSVYVGTAVPHHPLERVVAALLIHPAARSRATPRRPGSTAHHCPTVSRLADP